MHDVESSPAISDIDEGQLDVGGVAAITLDVPQVADAGWWTPERDRAPVELGTVRCPFEDPAPRRGSSTTRVSGSPDAEWPFGHHMDRRVVQTSKACSAGQSIS